MMLTPQELEARLRSLPDVTVVKCEAGPGGITTVEVSPRSAVKVVSEALGQYVEDGCLAFVPTVRAIELERPFDWVKLDALRQASSSSSTEAQQALQKLGSFLKSTGA